ncbi:MAG: hypothetical protein OEX77_06425 [Candidatus Bathyarchaeota archaeon]|nr:hypothetical protein [Candidatus Bathyarchaeota archaeon]MDH5733794.1 hypothetical protein [Candidatus Bathyarchaeota archaeon]
MPPSIQTSNGEKEEDEKKLSFGWKDILAFTIALLETVLLPLLIFIVVLVVILVLFSI